VARGQAHREGDLQLHEEQTEYLAVVATLDDQLRAACKDVLEPHYSFSDFDLSECLELRRLQMGGDLATAKQRLDPQDPIDRRILATIVAMQL